MTTCADNTCIPPTLAAGQSPFLEATVTTTDGTLTTGVTVAITENTVNIFEVYTVARRTGGADRAGYIRRAVIHREDGSAARQGTTDGALSRESQGVYDAQINVSGDNALIQVRGRTGHTVDWKIFHRTFTIP